MMKVLVTGGAGFIGSCLVAELLRDNAEVLVFDNFTTGRREFLPREDARLIVAEGDIVDYDLLLEVMKDWAPNVVIHLAGIHYIPFCNAHRLETLRINGEGTQSVLEACRNTGVERVVAASSAAVYGISDDAHGESQSPAPVDIYGISKWFDEILLRQFHQETGIACVIARLFNVYGPHETNPHVIPDLLEQLTTTDVIRLGNLEVCRDFVFVKDVAHALMALASAAGIEFEIVNVGTGTEHSVRDLVHVCAEIVQRDLRVQSVAARRRRIDRWHLLADCAHIREVVGWQPQYDLRHGLTETIRTTVLVPA